MVLPSRTIVAGSESSSPWVLSSLPHNIEHINEIIIIIIIIIDNDLHFLRKRIESHFEVTLLTKPAEEHQEEE